MAGSEVIAGASVAVGASVGLGVEAVPQAVTTMAITIAKDSSPRIFCLNILFVLSSLNQGFSQHLFFKVGAEYIRLPAKVNQLTLFTTAYCHQE